MISVNNLNKSFSGRPILKDVSFHVKKGEVLGFLGLNGAGKSTSMRILTGFLERDGGEISLCGFDPATQPFNVKRHVGYLPEGAPLWAEMTPRSFLSTISAMRAIKNPIQAIDVIAQSVKITHALDHPIGILSKGYKRRVGLAQALIHDPDILILDEPTDGLDPNQKHDVRQLIRSIAVNKAVIISTHILDEVSAICNRAVILHQGTIQASGTPSELAAKAPKSSPHRLEEAFRMITSPSKKKKTS